MERAERLSSRIIYEDRLFQEKIWKLLGSRSDLSPSDVDAKYYDFSVLPDDLKGKKLHRDAYQIYGITDQGEFVCDWIERWEFDAPEKEC